MSELYWADFAPVLPELFLAVAGMLLLIAGVFRGNEGMRMISWGVMGSFALAALFLLGLDWSDRLVAFNGLFVLDRFAGFMKLLVLIGLAASVALSNRYLEQENIARFEYPVLILFSGIGMMIMISSDSLITTYMGLELQSLALYVLAAYRRDFIKSAEAGIKYFILGALASGLMLFGISLIYGYTGALGFEDIAATLQGGTPVLGAIVGLVFVLSGVAFKISVVPFHMWTPDVYEGAPTSVTALFAIVPKVAAMALLMRLLFGPFGPVIGQWQQIVWFLSVASMSVGAFAAIAQTNIKRLMAYSSIGNMGYALIGLVAGTADGAGSVVLYMTIYMVMTAGVFAIILMMRRGGIAVEDIEDLSGLSHSSPLSAYAMAVLMFSMSGIPPMAGFFGKLFVFQAAVASGFYVLAVLGVLTSVVAAFYYLRIIKVMFFDEPIDVFDRQVSVSRRAVLALSIAFVLLFVVAPDSLIQSSFHAASVLFAAG